MSKQFTIATGLSPVASRATVSSLLGATMGSKADLFRVLELVEDGKLRPVLDRTLPLEQASEAHRLLEGRAQFGNVVLVP